ncbi:unnamed protein product [Paramecium octaurelia]|uniref:Protein kinase domain-containing protein n=1 Tax=Paramecium octaurelia TaxID=43137 RepID=A0A8S1WUI9_PAROT|nr:unnamed protein product [Paramecium octaurelia]
MNQALPILPSQINNTILKRMPNNDLILEYQIQQNTDCKDAYEWDLNASQLHQSALAQIVSVDFRIGTIALSYEKQQLLNTAIRNNNQLNQLYILFQLLEACYELHKRFSLGRCLSTSAIEIDPNSKIKIYRYGFSHNLMNKDELIQLAPETIFEDKVQISSDIWLIGMILYELAFKKSISQFKYPDQLSQYKNFIRTSMQNNTFDNLHCNFVDPRISIILQLLLIFDAEARVESYQAVILNLKDLLPQHKAKLDEILRFYENDITHINIKINSRSEKRDPPNRSRQRNVKSKSLGNKQIYYENLLHANCRIINQKVLKYAYTQNVQNVDTIYKLKILHSENQNVQNINLCQNINFQLYQISFLINLRQLIASLTKETELMILDKYLFVKTEQIVDLLINNIKNIKSILFTTELNHIQKLLGQIKTNYSDISKISDRLPARFLQTSLENQIKQFQQVLKNNNLTKQIATQISLRLLIAQDIEHYLADKSSVNLFFFPMKFYLGLSEITEPEEIERYLQRSTISQQIYMQNLLMKYKQQQQIQ